MLCKAQLGASSELCHVSMFLVHPATAKVKFTVEFSFKGSVLCMNLL
jgi:hypothetical protein